MDVYERHDGRRVCFIFNQKCTAACAHCITESSPKSTDKLDADEVRACLRSARDDGKTLAIFSGGEVFLHFDELAELITYATELGFSTMVETNAYWATNDDIARQKIEKLMACGLEVIHTSADTFRLPWVPLDRIVRFGRIAEQCGIEHDICFLYSGDEARDQEILERLGAEGVRHSRSRLFPFGNAEHLPKEAFLYEDLRAFGDCGDLQPTIAPNGDFVGCCNINIHTPGSPLYFGNIRVRPYTELLEEFERNPFVEVIRRDGFRRLVDALTEDERWRDFGASGHATICHLCHDLLCDPEKVAYLRRHLGAADPVPAGATPRGSLPVVD